MKYSSYRLGSQFVARSRFGRLKFSVTESDWVVDNVLGGKLWPVTQYILSTDVMGWLTAEGETERPLREYRADDWLVEREFYHNERVRGRPGEKGEGVRGV